MKQVISAVILTACSVAAHAAPRLFVYLDWTIGCDNTNHCDAVGYHQATEDALPVALSLSRDAGPGSPVMAALTQADDPPTTTMTISVGEWRKTGVPTDREWPRDLTDALIPRLLNADAAVFTSGAKTWRVSLAGVKAALLKMDEVQGRLDTRGALVRKGTKPESAVPRALPMPLLKAAGDRTGQAADLPPSILKALPKDECEENGSVIGKHLNASKLLILQECNRGAYQSAYRVYTASPKAPRQISRLMLPQADGSSLDDVVEADFSDGVLSSYAKGRGMNDCGASMEWLWTADGFQLLRYDDAPSCRGIPGGVPVRLYVAAKR